MAEPEAEMIGRARELATRAHAGQTDKAGAPYIGHPLRVAEKLASPKAKTVAWLHDVLEDDEKNSEAELRERFPDDVVDAVVALTRAAGKPDGEYYAQVRANPLAREVKLADIHDNLEPSRLLKLDEPTIDRLAAKYGSALVELYGP